MHLSIQDLSRRLGLIMIIMIICAPPSQAQLSKSDWNPINQAIALEPDEAFLNQTPKAFLLTQIDLKKFQKQLRSTSANILLPEPDGSYSEYHIQSTKVVAEEVAHFYSIQTFRGFKVGAPSTLIACDISSEGFHASVFSGSDTYFIEPYSRNDKSLHISYYRKDIPNPKIKCGTHDHAKEQVTQGIKLRTISEPYKETYRLAMVASGEYAQQFGGSPYNVTNVLNALAAGVNVINVIYSRDVGIDFDLVTTPDLVYDDPVTDPFDTGNQNNLVEDCHEACVNNLGTDGFDVGHLVIWDLLGGLAGIGVACKDNSKGHGFSGYVGALSTLWIDYICHEIGHQFNAQHNFAADECGESAANYRFEPGEGSSIMCYAGLCGAPVSFANTSDPFFHYASIARMRDYISLKGCGAQTPGNLFAPDADAKANISIPKNTPFILVGEASDSNDDTENLTYQWEQYDGAGLKTTGLPDCSVDDEPLFKFRPPVQDSFREFPDYNQVLLGNNNGNDFEKLPCTKRSMTFSFAVRDNNIDFGRVNHDEMIVSVLNTGPFEITSPNGGENLTGNNDAIIAWDENNTSGHCPLVDVHISLDGGLTYTILADAIPNSGSASLTFPNVNTSTARLLISCNIPGEFRSGSTFYDVCDGNFTITAAMLTDADGDGWDISDDCDDNNDTVHPFADEICDGLDNDCDGLIDAADPNAIGLLTFYEDLDQDGYGNPAVTILACELSNGYVTDNTDCDDTNGSIHPDADEICNGIDDDCDGLIDTADPSLTGATTWYLDNDGDGHGDPAIFVEGCTAPANHVVLGDDCDDNNNTIYPGAAEICNGIDDDCDGLIDSNDPNLTGAPTWYEDADNDNYGSLTSFLIACTKPNGYISTSGDCNDANSNINPGAQEICNNIDDDCDGLIDGNDPDVFGALTWYADADGDNYGDPNSIIVSCNPVLGYISIAGDCNDNNRNVNPSAQEICNNIDDDCDGLIDINDPSLAGTSIWYADIDGDSYGNPQMPRQSCTQPLGFVSNMLDCDDTNGNINPGATEICNNIDDDCDGLIDSNDPSVFGASTWYRDADMDGYGSPIGSIVSCNRPLGYVSNNNDCNDNDDNVSPSNEEVCNGIDDDCDGLIDQADPSVIDLIVWFADLDGDGYGNQQNMVMACSRPNGFVAQSGDCNDGDPAIHPLASELCNGIDDDCDGLVDNDDPSLTGDFTWYADADGDGYGNPAFTIQDCGQPTGFVSNDLDCNDTNGLVNPGQQEICNGIDDDCDGLTDQDDPDVTGTNLWYADNDGDNFGDAQNTLNACSQPLGYTNNSLDCDDSNPLVNPNGQEVCNGFDDDCDGLVDANDPDNQGDGVWYQDLDNDNYGNSNITENSCVKPSGFAAVAGDCNDNNSAINPGAQEICNGIDDDCDGLTDSADPSLSSTTTWYQDADNDGFGNNLVKLTDCTQPSGYVSNNTDCDDTNSAINPNAPEICNGIDDDCDGLIDSNDPNSTGSESTWYQDLDGDSFGNLAVFLESCTQPNGYVNNGVDCNDNDAAIFPGAPEICNGIDDDCDGLTDGADPDVQGGNTTYYQDADGDTYGNPMVSQVACSLPVGYVTNNTDCDDTNNLIHPGAQEVCNGFDDDCNGLTDMDDPNLAGVGLWFADLDGDSFGDPNNTLESCTQPPGYTFDRQDCNDNDAAINPNAVEICNDIDDNCDGLIDEDDTAVTGIETYFADTDNDGYGDPNVSVSGCDIPTGFVDNDEDCDDMNMEIHPGVSEILGNGIDDNCDGILDNKTSTAEQGAQDFNFYPNPAIDYVIIDSEQATEVQIKIINIQGQVLSIKDKVQLPARISLTELEVGAYMIELSSTDNKIKAIEKVIKLY